MTAALDLTQDPVELTAALVDIASVSGAEAALADAVETALAGIDGEIGEWRVVNCVFARSRVAKTGREWAGLVEFRVRIVRG